MRVVAVVAWSVPISCPNPVCNIVKNLKELEMKALYIEKKIIIAAVFSKELCIV